jgi:GDPmannose 4,6-dehydratase
VNNSNSIKKRALITGITGQDGALLAHFLLKKNYIVMGTSRDLKTASMRNLQLLGLTNQVELISLPLTDFRQVKDAVAQLRPDEIYHLAGQSSVALSFSQPRETIDSISVSTLNLLEAIRLAGRKIRFYNAGSGEMFGPQKSVLNEQSIIAPKSPYAVAKAASFNLVATYRESYDLHACTGILFNHESPLRSENFVTKKIVHAANAISLGRMNTLPLGNIEISRDWGWAPEYVEAIWKMVQLPRAEDLVVATGETNSLKEFLHIAFAYFDLDWQKYVQIDSKLSRPFDLDKICVDSSRAKLVLGWHARTNLESLIQHMINFEREQNLKWLESSPSQSFK